MRGALKYVVCVVALFVSTLVITVRGGEPVLAQNTLETQSCSVDVSSYALSDLFSEVVCSTGASNNLTQNRRLTPSSNVITLLCSTLFARERNDDLYRGTTAPQASNLAVQSKSRSLYYIYALHRIRI